MVKPFVYDIIFLPSIFYVVKEKLNMEIWREISYLMDDLEALNKTKS